MIYITLAIISLPAAITLNALAENYRLVREWRKDHGR